MGTHSSTDESYRASRAARWQHSRRDDDNKAATNVVEFPHSELSRGLAPETGAEPRSNPADAIEPRLPAWTYRLKNAEDRVLAASMLLITGPLLAFIALAVKIDSPGPALTERLQLGFGGALIPVWKFRCVPLDQATQLTGVGRFLRASSLEDLPQLFSVLSGKLSIVGPQPYVPSGESEKPSILVAVDRCATRRQFRPGITSLSRVNDRCVDAVSAGKLEKRAKDDLSYMNDWSIWLDIRIIFRSVRLFLMEPQV